MHAQADEYAGHGEGRAPRRGALVGWEEQVGPGHARDAARPVTGCGCQESADGRHSEDFEEAGLDDPEQELLSSNQASPPLGRHIHVRAEGDVEERRGHRAEQETDHHVRIA